MFESSKTLTNLFNFQLKKAHYKNELLERAEWWFPYGLAPKLCVSILNLERVLIYQSKRFMGNLLKGLLWKEVEMHSYEKPNCQMVKYN